MSYFQPYIDASGIHMPTYEDRLQDLLSAYRSIFGQEAELSPAVPDYQLLSVLAKALDDTSAFVLQAYNSRNPAYAAGQALDLLLPQYGIVREAGESDASVRARMNLVTASRGSSPWSPWKRRSGRSRTSPMCRSGPMTRILLWTESRRIPSPRM